MPVPPLRHLIRLFRPEFGEIRTLLAFSIVVGLLTLATPIAVEALVNTVAFASEMQPILILGIIVLACLALAAIVLATEAQLVERSDGSLMINCRDNRGGSRAVLTTSDLGRTWTDHPTSRRALPEPVCMASLIRVDHEELGSLLVFSNPATYFHPVSNTPFLCAHS